MVITQSSFRQWFRENVDEHQRGNIRRHGCAMGIPHLIYDSEMRPLWDKFSLEIFDIAYTGQPCPDCFQHKKFTCPSEILTAVIWLAAENLAYEMETDGEAA